MSSPAVSGSPRMRAEGGTKTWCARSGSSSASLSVSPSCTHAGYHAYPFPPIDPRVLVSCSVVPQGSLQSTRAPLQG